MSTWHYSGCGCTADSDYQEIDPEGEYCDECIYYAKNDELPGRLQDPPVVGPGEDANPKSKVDSNEKDKR